MIDSVDNLELLEGNGVDLVEGVEARDVLPVAFDDVDDVVLCGVAFDAQVGVVDLVLPKDGFNGLIIHLDCINSPRYTDASFVSPFKVDLRWGLIQPNPEPFELMLQNFLMLHGSSGIQDDHNQVAGPRHRNDLFSSSLSILRSLNNSRKIQQLNFRAFVLDHTRNTCQGGELVRCYLREGSCEFGEQGGFPN